MACRPPGPVFIDSHALQNPRVFRMVPFTELSKAGLEPSRPRFYQFAVTTELSCFPCGFLSTELSKAGLQASRSDSINSRSLQDVAFSPRFPLQTCLKLACSPGRPDSTNSYSLQNSCVFRKGSLAELSEAGLHASRVPPGCLLVLRFLRFFTFSPIRNAFRLT